MTSFAAKLSAYASLAGLALSSTAVAQVDKGYKIAPDERVTFDLRLGESQGAKPDDKASLTIFPSKVIEGDIRVSNFTLPIYLEINHVVGDIQNMYDRGGRMGMFEANWLIKPTLTLDSTRINDDKIDTLRLAQLERQDGPITNFSSEAVAYYFKNSSERLKFSPLFQDVITKAIVREDFRLTKERDQKFLPQESYGLYDEFTPSKAPEGATAAMIIIGMLIANRMRGKKSRNKLP